MENRKPRRTDENDSSRSSVEGSGSGKARLVRLVVPGPPPDSLAKAQALLLQGFDEIWPSGLRASFTITMGGFLRSDFSTPWSGGTGWESSGADFAALVEAARPAVTTLFSPRVISAAARCTQFVTLGIDLSFADGLHAELIAVVDAASGAVVHWSGKSFPMAAQSHRLIQVADLGTHHFEGAGERVLLLGCHDLSIYNPKDRRTLGEGSPRWLRCRDMDTLITQRQPTMVLHHPHNVDSPQTFAPAWQGLTKKAASASCWASGIAYFNRDEGCVPRRSLEDVLRGTRSPQDIVDVVATAQRARSTDRQAAL